MAKNPDKIEIMAKELECTAPRITKESIDANIKEVDYVTVVIAGQKFMYCGIKMSNGFVAVGNPSTCVDEKNWREAMVKEISYNNSYEGLWQLEAYRRMVEIVKGDE